MADRRCSPKRGGSKSGEDSGVPAAGVYKRELGDGEEAVRCFSRVDFTWTRREHFGGDCSRKWIRRRGSGWPADCDGSYSDRCCSARRERRERGVRKERLTGGSCPGNLNEFKNDFFSNLVCSKSDFPEFEHFG
jgi:hypothetical protein